VMASNATTITMSMREADRLKTVQAVLDRMLRVGQAAQRLGLSRRQLERKRGPSTLLTSTG
jgi:transcriptional regulator GlxA family with amidase domain